MITVAVVSVRRWERKKEEKENRQTDRQTE